MAVSENIFPKLGKNPYLADYEGFDEIIEVPPFKGRTAGAKSYSAGTGSDSDNSYSYSILPTLSQNDRMFGTLVGHSIEQGYSRGVSKGAKKPSTVSTPVIAMNNPLFYSSSSVGHNRSFSSGTIAERWENTRTQLNRPFSEKTGIPGPMRLEGEEDLPPPEGDPLPIGNGVGILALLAGTYMFFRRKIA